MKKYTGVDPKKYLGNTGCGNTDNFEVSEVTQSFIFGVDFGIDPKHE